MLSRIGVVVGQFSSLSAPALMFHIREILEENEISEYIHPCQSDGKIKTEYVDY